jgi:hypothetical protein
MPFGCVVEDKRAGWRDWLTDLDTMHGDLRQKIPKHLPNCNWESRGSNSLLEFERGGRGM